MNWQKLFQMQKELDNKIHQEKGLTREETFEKRILALFVELGELLNKWEKFKYWKDGRSKYTFDEVLEEYVDTDHFLLSLGNDIGVTDLQYREPTKQKDIYEQVNDLYDMISVFRVLEGEKQKDHYHKMFSQFIRIGQQMGFTMEQVYEAYMSKNEVNHERLQSGY